MDGGARLRSRVLWWFQLLAGKLTIDGMVVAHEWVRVERWLTIRLLEGKPR